MSSTLNLKTWNDFGSKLLQEKGHKRQKEFLTSCKQKDDFSCYMNNNLHGYYRSSSSSFLSDYEFTEAEFCSPPEDTQNMIWDRLNSCQLDKETLSDVCFWGEVVFNLIERDQLKPEWLASSKGNSLEEGGYFIDRALNSNDSKMLDDCVRKILRSMCNPRPRGRRVVFCDFSLGRA
ncbi:MAG: hypothetical protein F4X92_00110, partial [Gammaproteobacteria bacterium]|nr:hypothetical protein [Gammaproteobacteria bacterium]